MPKYTGKAGVEYWNSQTTQHLEQTLRFWKGLKDKGIDRKRAIIEAILRKRK